MTTTAVFEYTIAQQHAYSYISGVNSIADALGLRAQLAAYTTASITKTAFTQQDDIPSEIKAFTYDLDTYAMLFFRDGDDNVVQLAIPSPVTTMFEIVRGNYAVKKAVGNDLAAKLGAKIGKTLTFRHGGLLTRNVTV